MNNDRLLKKLKADYPQISEAKLKEIIAESVEKTSD
jgi:uncharacterized protein (DUF433 family)